MLLPGPVSQKLPGQIDATLHLLVMSLAPTEVFNQSKLSDLIVFFSYLFPSFDIDAVHFPVPCKFRRLDQQPMLRIPHYDVLQYFKLELQAELTQV